MAKEINVLMGTQKPPQPQPITRIDTKNIPSGTIRQRHLEAGLFAVKIGLAADRPSDGGEFRVFFATDTGVMSAWNGSTWVSSAAFT